MAYTKQNFEDGQVLTAAHMNHIENGISDLESKGVDLSEAAKAELVNEVRAGLGTTDVVGALPLTGGSMLGALNMNGHRVYGVANPTSSNDVATVGLVKKAAPRNLLDNSDFSNPVNQRGQTSYTNGYTIDRWFNQSNGSVSIGDGYLTFTPKDDNANQVWLEQKTEKCEYLLGKRITLAVEYADGHTEIDNATVSNDEFSYKDITGIIFAFGLIENGLLRTALVFRGDSVDLRSIALYEGEYTIDTLPEYQPKGYGAELAECQRYYFESDFNTQAIAFDAYSFYAPYMYLPVQMRENCNISVIPVSKNGTQNALSRWTGSEYADVTNYIPVASKTAVSFRSDGGFVTGSIYATGKVIVSADIL